jgi:hypothetical protein
VMVYPSPIIEQRNVVQDPAISQKRVILPKIVKSAMPTVANGAVAGFASLKERNRNSCSRGLHPENSLCARPDTAGLILYGKRRLPLRSRKDAALGQD